MPQPTAAELLAELKGNPANLTCSVGIDDTTTVERLEDVYAPPLGDDTLVVACLNDKTRRRPVRVPWAEIWRYLDTQQTPADSPVPNAPIRYALEKYETTPNANGATAAACWMAAENWRHPSYPDVDVHDDAFTAFAGGLVGAKLLDAAHVEHIVDELGTVPASRGEELWGAGVVVTLDDIVAARNIDPDAIAAAELEAQRIAAIFEERRLREEAEKAAAAAAGAK